jgi:chromosome segregation ATPase
MATRAEIGRNIRTAQGQLANESSHLAALRRQREQVEMLVIEIRNRRAEFADRIGAARARVAGIFSLQTNVRTAGGYGEHMNSAVFAARDSRALSHIDDMRGRAEQRLRQIDSQIAQTQSSLLTLQRRIDNLNYQYRTCGED